MCVYYEALQVQLFNDFLDPPGSYFAAQRDKLNQSSYGAGSVNSKLQHGIFALMPLCLLLSCFSPLTC
jgi:hypothetical protein